jgi:hypothetical protein
LSTSLGISLQIGASSLSDFVRNPHNQEAHQMPVLLADTNPALVGLPDLLGQQSIQQQRCAFRREVSWFWLGHG